MDKEYQKFLDEAKDYARLRYDLLKLELLEKSSQIIAIIVLILILVGTGVIALTYLSLAAVQYVNTLLGSHSLGYCIFGGVFVILALLVLIFRKQIILNPLLKQLSKIMFAKSDEEAEDK